MEKRTFRAIALEIRSLWPKPYFGAKPYIDAMTKLDTTGPNQRYVFESAGEVVQYFLANASTFRGPDAKRIKAELKSMLNEK